MPLYDDIVATRAELRKLATEEEDAYNAYKAAELRLRTISELRDKVRRKYEQRVAHYRRGNMKCYCRPKDSNIHSKGNAYLCTTCGSCWEE